MQEHNKVKLTMNESPQSQCEAKPEGSIGVVGGPVHITDSTGRHIIIDEPTSEDYLYFLRATGSSGDMMNPLSAYNVMPLMYIKSVDGVPFKKPQTPLELIAAYKIVGMKAIPLLIKKIKDAKLYNPFEAMNEGYGEELKK